MKNVNLGVANYFIAGYFQKASCNHYNKPNHLNPTLDEGIGIASEARNNPKDFQCANPDKKVNLFFGQTARQSRHTL